MNISNLIYVKENVLSEIDCQEIIEKFNNDDRKYSGTVGSIHKRVNTSLKKSKDLSISLHSDWKKHDEMIYEIFNHHLNLYFQNLDKKFGKIIPYSIVDLNIKTFKDLGYIVRSYEEGEGYYHWHNDFVLTLENGLRLFTFILYLNDVEAGGETEFIDGTIITPKTGKILIFPTSWYLVHRGKMPKTSVKYIITGWLFGKNW